MPVLTTCDIRPNSYLEIIGYSVIYSDVNFSRFTMRQHICLARYMQSPVRPSVMHQYL